MDLNELKDQLDNDVKIDATKLQWEALNNPVVYSKWLRVYSEAKREIIALEAKKKKATKNKLDFYTNRSDSWCREEYSTSELKVVMPADSAGTSHETACPALSNKVCRRRVKPLMSSGLVR